jgi:S-(hydroxymethyl)glutathione dehydrogenase/alcohol dehydrogenase
MKAAVCYEFGKPLVVEDVKIDPPQRGEVKVRIAATAICYSDVHVIRGHLKSGLPVVGGHESSGYIEEVGEGVTSLKPGDHVAISLVTSCGTCPSCLNGFPNVCEFDWPLAKGSRLTNKKGERLAHGLKTATFAEYAIVDQSQAVKIPSDMSMDTAALLSCGVITGYGAVVNSAKVRPLSSVVVIGTGAVALNSIQGAAISGAYPIIVVDTRDSRFKMAEKFGATHIVNAKGNEAIEAVKKLTGGRGAEYVFVSRGNVNAIKEGFLMSSPHGMTVMLGLPSITDILSFERISLEFIRLERTLTGSFMGSTNIHTDIPKLVAAYKAGKLKLDELITKRYPLEKINEAIEASEQGDSIRNVIMF